MVSAMKKAVESMFNFDKQAKCSKAGLDEVLGISLLFSGMSQAINAVGDGVKTEFRILLSILIPQTQQCLH